MATLKNTTINDTGFFKLPAGDTAARPDSPNGRQIRFNTETGKLEQFRPDLGDWIAPNNTGVIATGGDSVYDVDVEGTTYRVHVFTSTGTSTFEVLQGGEAEYLIVAGGGCGGIADDNSGAGGGGGAGGVISGKTVITTQDYTVTVGSGGDFNGSSFSGGSPNNGSNSVAFGNTTIGGGAGGGRGNPGDGGSGGGGYRNATGGSGIAGQGNDGGSGYDGGGGGGAGAPGENANGGDGGNGLSFAITGLSTFYAGGGGGARGPGQTSGSGGAGGGGGGGAGPGDAGGNEGEPGTPNTGGGGGGGSTDSQDRNSNGFKGGDGGSGIVVIRYPLRQENPVTAPGRDVGDGLVLDLDFAKPTVYSGSGSVVTDGRLNGIEGDILGTTFIESTRTHNSNFRFTGDGSNIDLGRPAAFNREFEQITIEFVTRRISGGSSGDGGVIFSCELVKNGSFYARLDRGPDFHFRSWHTGSGDSGNQRFSGFNYDQWYHMVVTWDGSVKRGYLNGQQVGSEFSESGALVNSGANVIIGARGSTPDRGIDGNIGLCRVYDRALSDTEILQRYETVKWRFDF